MAEQLFEIPQQRERIEQAHRRVVTPLLSHLIYLGLLLQRCRLVDLKAQRTEEIKAQQRGAMVHNVERVVDRSAFEGD